MTQRTLPANKLAATLRTVVLPSSYPHHLYSVPSPVQAEMFVQQESGKDTPSAAPWVILLCVKHSRLTQEEGAIQQWAQAVVDSGRLSPAWQCCWTHMELRGSKDNVQKDTANGLGELTLGNKFTGRLMQTSQWLVLNHSSPTHKRRRSE